MSAYRRTAFDRMLMGGTTVAVGLIVGAAVLMVISLWWPYDPLPRLELAVEASVQAGTELPVTLDYCKARSGFVPREVRWTLVNDVMIAIDGPQAALPVGCDPARRIDLPLSDHVAPGRYRLQVDVIYQPWPWREFVYTRRSAPFTIWR